MEKTLNIYSGDVCMCPVGIPVGVDDLHTGDIVLLWHGEYLGTDNEQWTPCNYLTAVVADQSADGEPVPYVMGIRSCGFNDPAYRIQRMKRFTEVVPNENWKAFGFRYAH